MSGQPPDISVIVLFGRGQLEPCLSSLLAQKDASFEIIGMAGSDELKVNDPRVKMLVIPDPNPAKRRNLAVAQARGKYLAFIDDDATAPEDWLARAKKYFEQNPEMAGFGGSNIGPDNMSWREQLTDMLLIDKYFGSGSGSYAQGGGNRWARPGELHLSNFFLRRESFNAVGGFNEKLGYGGEDSEMVYQVKKKTRLDFGFYPDIFVWHQRRKFGWEFLSRNFKFRRKNGKLIWLYPDMYGWNWQLVLAAALVAVAGSSVAIKPAIFLFYLPAYYLFFFVRSWLKLNYRRWLSLLMPFAYFFHHVSYLLGLSVGLVEGLVTGRKKLQQLLGRD